MAANSAEIIGVHLDLKYIMPNKDYLLTWVKRLPAFGINAILVEYEDKFPFAKYPFLCEEGAFTPDELKAFLAAAREAGVQPIPLVQTFAHLEFALTHAQLAHLRGAPEVHTHICPSNPEAVELVQTLVREVLAYHQEEDYFHLGGDECWFLGTCSKCKAWLEQCGSPEKLWAEHQMRIMPIVQEAGKRPIYWDDIFWKRPEMAGEVGLPKDVVFHCWNYNITDLGAKGTDKQDSELGGTSKKLKQVDAYRAAGYETIAGPCLDWGILYPQHSHCLQNTQAWAQKTKDAGMLGMLNTGWACFHVPLGAKWLHTAATGALCSENRRTIDDAWQSDFVKAEYGAEVEGVPEALETLGEIWEVSIQELGRPLNPVLYGYMEMVLHYEGAQEERRQRGGYPRDWNEVNFVGMYRRKIELLKAHPDSDAILAKVDALLKAYADAAGTLRALADAATQHQAEAAYLAGAAEIKLLHTRVLSHLLRQDGDGQALLAALEPEGETIAQLLAPFLEPVSIERMKRIWWEPTCEVLKASL